MRVDEEHRAITACALGLSAGLNEIQPDEPLDVTFFVTNTGTQTFYLETGGDSRGARSDRVLKQDERNKNQCCGKA